MKDLIYTLGSIASLALGLFQLVTITIGLHNYLGWHYVFTVFLALCLAPWPIIGTVAAIWASMYAWHWSLVQACLILGAAMVVMMLLTSTPGGVANISKRRRPKRFE